MFIELYMSNEAHPPLFDAYIDRHGNLYGMSPVPRIELEDLMQVVLEDGPRWLTADQKGAIEFLMKMNSVDECHLYHEIATAYGPICRVLLYDLN
ncbi:hypothetical protein ELG77_08815 [Rhizobium leguminosarum]|uniref:hypothetical protein n=1 Tax=Rhizobium leguminosarum TaxID=384 RepID=UPI00102FF22C|nr:hypothetical protein [Rhizobium leguminosarum]TBG41864.1 hypothetical protein ELG77_08815 [Rhizobium leguminosarum]